MEPVLETYEEIKLISSLQDFLTLAEEQSREELDMYKFSKIVNSFRLKDSGKELKPSDHFILDLQMHSDRQIL
jgi:hypothetical protein